MNRLLFSVMAGAAIGLSAGHADEPFPFEKNDQVVLIGNSLAERMQHHGWLETLIQERESAKEISFRNLAFPGDQVANRPRSKGFTSPEDYLKHCEADVILVFFGYNESFAGEEGLPAFREQLANMIDAYRDLRPNGKSAPRIVLCSPIAHEDLQSPNLPDGIESNKRLTLYTDTIRQVATEKKTRFIDLFTASRSLYEQGGEALTINGVHLNETGNKRIAEVIASALYREPVTADGDEEELRKAILDKNWHWHNRYRATNGNDVWGSRSTLAFVDGQTNAEVLQHELVMLDVMTANRDRRIWALARGSDLSVDDGNVPPPIPVKSNVGGGSRSSNAMKEGNLDYISGEEGIDHMTLREGFAVNLFADESMFPELVNPVQMQVDGKGRLWVSAWKTYPKWEPLEEMDDRILILPDEDRDGVADRVIEFAKVHNPLGFEFWNGGVLVTNGPDLVFLKDTDGDDRADVREIVLHGLGTSDTHHAANNLIYGPDGAIYWQSGIFLQNNFEHPWGPSLATGNSAMYRFDPRRFTISYHAENPPNPHGIAFDRWGYHYATDGTGGRAYQVVPSEEGFEMRKLLEKEVRPVPASEIVSSTNFPADMQQDFLICNTIGFLGIKHYDLDRDGGEDYTVTEGRGKNATTTAHTTAFGEVWGRPGGDFLVSSDKNFRPSDAVFGGDGALYVADWHNVIIGHMQHNIRDPNRDHRHGRIYRIVHEGSPLQAPVAIDGEPLPALLALLTHEVDGVRHRTRIELSERDSGDVIAATEDWIATLDPRSEEDAHALLEALWLHQQHNVRNTELLNDVLQSPHPHARVAAATVQHHWFNVDHTLGGSPAERDSTEQPDLKSGVLSDAGGVTHVQINCVIEQMRFDVKEFTVQAGRTLKVTFSNPDFLPHNLVFVQPGAIDEVAMTALQLGEKGFRAGYIPDHPKIIASGTLLDHGAEEEFTFPVPGEPGEYGFVCTFPGHHILMRGTMKVVK